jgi:hypothetical protein
MSSLSSNLNPMTSRRRSQRVLLRMPIFVVTINAEKQPLSEQSHTVVVNAHGGLILLSMKVFVGQSLIIRNLETGEERSCRVAFTNPSQDGKHEVGLEFSAHAANFWRVSFPPSDWTPQVPEITSSTF